MESRDTFRDYGTKCDSNDNDDDTRKYVCLYFVFDSFIFIIFIHSRYVRAMIFCHTCEKGYHFKCTSLPGSFKVWHRKCDNIFICDECEGKQSHW